MERLRRADPAASLRVPDERAEADLRLLLDEPRPAAAPAPRRGRPRLAPVLVTAFVALVVIALTAAVLGVVHPRTDVGGGVVAPTTGTGACRPAQVLPFRCGTYESTYGGKAVTGDLGGPAKDRLRISFTQQDGALLLSASTVNCFAERVLVRFDGKRLVRIGAPQYSQNDCNGPGADRRSWAYAFLNGPLETTDGETYSLGSDDRSVFFEYQGVAPIGAAQLPRNDRVCVPAHVAPFSCATYFSSGGTGALAFLGRDLFRLSFDHLNGQLTAALGGRCNTLSTGLQTDGDTVVASDGASTAMGCLGAPGRQDAAVQRFFSGVLTFSVTRDGVEFRSGSGTAVFTSAISACHPASSPFCGSFRSTGGNGSIAFLTSSRTGLAFRQDGALTVATLRLGCGTRTYAVALDRPALRFRPLSVAGHSCSADAARRDATVDAFLRAGVTWRWNGSSLDLDAAASEPADSAQFTR